MQNKQAIIGIVAAAVILVGAGGVFLYSKNKPAPQPSSTSTATEQTKTESTMSNSLTDLLSSGKTQKCTFNYSDENGGTEGTAYINNQNMRADLNITTADKKVSQMSMIRKDDDNYIWGGGFPSGTGLKMTLSADEFTNDTESKKYFDASKKADYDCSGWTVDSSLFVPPSNIKFSDLSSMMQGLMKSETKPSGTTNSTGANCSVCNNLTGDAKTACMSSLGC